MSSTIESAGLFSEAAYGVDGPQGLTGVTGGGESHEIAWKQALQDAKASLPQSTHLQSAVPDGASGAAVEPLVSADTAASHIKAANPMSWDRLSMTVASMVAWNMSVELADDVSASPLIDGTLPEPTRSISSTGTVVDEAELPSAQLAPTSPHLTPSVELGANEASGGIAGSTQPVASAQAIEDGSATPEVQPYAGLLDEGEGSDSTAMAQRAVSTSRVYGEEPQRAVPEKWTAKSNGSEASRQGVNPLESISSAATGSGNAFGVGISPVPQNEIHSSQQLVVKASVNELTHAMDASNNDDAAFESVIRVRSTSVERPEITEGRQRLEAIRHVLARLDQQAVERNAVSQVIRQPVLNPQVSTPAMAGAVGASTVTGPVSRGTDPALSSTSNSVEQAAGETVMQPEADTSRPFDGAVRRSDGQPSRLMKAGRTGPNAVGSMRESSAIDPNALTGMSAEASVVGAENSEITKDQNASLETFRVDAEVIDSSEIPELAIQDVSHLDIDIDDPLGSVRLAMTREAEEVSIRMETPEEVLQQYREMEEEIAEAVAQQGLDLGQFSADAQNSGGDDASSDTPRSNQSFTDPKRGSDGGEKSLEQSGTVSRLVNRIV